MKCPKSPLALMILALWAVPGAAWSCPSPPESTPVCAAFHADDGQDTPVGALHSVFEGPYTVDITHTGPWNEPTELTPEHISVLEAHDGFEACEGWAVVQISVPLGDCGPGEYLLTDGEYLGPARVTGFLDGIVLTELDEDLRYIRAEGAAHPTWRMIWRAPFTISRPAPAAAQTPAQRRAKARKARKNRRRRNR